MTKRILLSLFFLTFLTLGAPRTDAAPEGWLTDVDEARTAAARGERMILVDLFAEWCGWCKVLEQKVFTTPEFRKFADPFVLLHVDVEDGGQGSELQVRFGATSLPTTLILDSKMVKVGEVRGFLPAAEYIAEIGRQLEAYDSFLEYYRRAKETDDQRRLRSLAEELHERGDGGRAIPVYERLLQLTPSGGAPVAWLHYQLADAYRLDNNLGRAGQSLARARALAGQIDDAQLDERLDLLSFYIAQDEGNCKQAKASLERFIELHPRSVFSGKARRTLRALNQGDGILCT